MVATNVRGMPLQQLADECAQHTSLFLRNLPSDEAFCYELFRRAIVLRDQQAWERIANQYRSQIEKKMRLRGAGSEMVDELIQLAMVNFWKSYTASKFLKSKSLAQVLAYFDACTITAIQKYRRSEQVQRKYFDELDAESEGRPARMTSAQNVASEVADRLERQQLWQFVEAHCTDEADRLLAHREFIEGQKPQTIFAQNSSLFASVSEVYQRHQNLIARMRRDNNRNGLWSQDDA